MDKIYKVGVYTRLSKEDGTGDESASIETQKAIIRDYVTKQGWQITKIYVDDGFSGTNFNRPDFQRMLQDIENGIINCVVTKDLSRLGRNYIDCGFYMEMYFPKHNVRYIAINDGVDTLNNSGMDITPFKNILNEMYAQDISKKIKSALKIRFENGNFRGSFAPYGYIKDPNNKNHLLIDEEVRHIVRLIYDMALDGKGVRSISRYLSSQKILKPSAYKVSKGNKAFEFETQKGVYNWTENSVREILRSATYCGGIVGYKRPTTSFKNKKRAMRKPEDWQVVYDTHEGIVTREEFELVQNLMNKRRYKKRDDGFTNVFAGIIKCADCGYRMRAVPPHRVKRENPIDNIMYVCATYHTGYRTKCTGHKIEARTIFDIVLNDINYYARESLKDEKIIKKLQQQLNSNTKQEIQVAIKEQKKTNKRLLELDDIVSSLYEDKALKRISERNYDKMMAKYIVEQEQLSEKVKELSAKVTDQEIKDRSAIDFINMIKNYEGITELTPRIVNALIDRIEISEKAKNEDGSYEQRIKIYYKFVGALKTIDFGEVKVKPVMQVRKLICPECNKEFETTSAVAKYCENCRRIVQKRQSVESKRRCRALERAKKKKVA